MKINEKKEVIMIGCLASEPIYDNDRRISPILVNKNGDLQFTIKPLSNIIGLPELDEPPIYISGYSTDLTHWGFDDRNLSDEDSRIKALEQFLDNQVLPE